MPGGRRHECISTARTEPGKEPDCFRKPRGSFVHNRSDQILSTSIRYPNRTRWSFMAFAFPCARVFFGGSLQSRPALEGEAGQRGRVGCAGKVWLSWITPSGAEPAGLSRFGVDKAARLLRALAERRSHFVVVFALPPGSSCGFFALAEPRPLLVRRRHASTITIAPPLQGAARLSQRCCSGVPHANLPCLFGRAVNAARGAETWKRFIKPVLKTRLCG